METLKAIMGEIGRMIEYPIVYIIDVHRSNGKDQCWSGVPFRVNPFRMNPNPRPAMGSG
jgi:hypothetical protein